MIGFEQEIQATSTFRVISKLSYGMTDAAPDWSLMLGFERRF
jgi:hypothetical protein